MPLFLLALAGVLLSVVLPAEAGKKARGVPLVHLPTKSAAIADLALPAPGQKCENWAWAAAVEAILRAQNVALQQNFWVQKLNGGEVCVDVLPAPDLLARAVTGLYVLDDGRKVRLQVRNSSGPPTTPDDIIAPLLRGVPLLVLWKGRALLLHNVLYDEYIFPNSQRMFQITAMKLLDPLAPPEQREVSFVNGKDDPSEIIGMLEITAISEQVTHW